MAPSPLRMGHGQKPWRPCAWDAVVTAAFQRRPLVSDILAISRAPLSQHQGSRTALSTPSARARACVRACVRQIIASRACRDCQSNQAPHARAQQKKHGGSLGASGIAGVPSARQTARPRWALAPSRPRQTGGIGSRARKANSARRHLASARGSC